MNYKNPNISGFNPDPSICRVGEDYYLVTSSFHYFPGVPIYHSRDLTQWRHIGYCLTRPSQLDLTGIGPPFGIWAPTIRYHDGLFYMVTTLMPEGGHFFVTAADPAGEWSNPVWIRTPGIDPSLFWEDGRVYLQTNTAAGIATRSLVQVEINPHNGDVLSPRVDLWTGAGWKHTEAPHIYRRKGWYYLLAAEGGTSWEHRVTVARSRNLWGPYESAPHNPILCHTGRDSAIHATGHGDLVEAQDGSWWIVFLGIRPVGRYHHLGRETFLAPVQWTDDDWPCVHYGQLVTLEMEVTAGTAADMPTFADETFEDDFVQPQLPVCWNFIRNPYMAHYRYGSGQLELLGTPVSLNDAGGSPTFLGSRQKHFACSAQTELRFEAQNAQEEAGLCVMMDHDHHYACFLTLRNGQRCVVLRLRIGGLSVEVHTHPVQSDTVTLSVQSTAKVYRFACTEADQEPHVMGEALTRYLSSEVAGGFTGVYIGLYATGNGSVCADWARYTYFRYREEGANGSLSGDT